MSDETSGKGPGDRKAYRADPRYTEGDLVRVVQAMNQAEAEFVPALLREEGIPSMLRRTRGFDVPDMLAAGPRDVLVPRSGASAAREVLLQAELLEEPAAGSGVDRPSRVLAVLLAVVALVAVVAWLGTEILV
jgi:pimeloyl-ACP methyl ester carboxylesterase